MRWTQLAGVAALVAGATAVSMFAETAAWVGSWSETGAAFELSSRLSYPLVGAAAAWIGSAARRQRFDHLLAGASRSAGQVHLRACVVLALAAVAGTVPPMVAALLATGSEANFGQAPVASVLVVWAGMLAAAGFGVLVGVLFPSAVASPVALVLVYAVPLLADSGRPSLAPLAGLTVADDRARTYFQTSSEILGLRALWLLVLAWLFVTLAARARNRWLVPFGLTCLAAVPLLLAGQDAMRPIAAAGDAVCDSRTPDVTVCLTRARSHAMDQVEGAVSGVSDVLSPLAPGGIEYREELLGGPPTAQVVGGRLVVPFAATNGVNGEAHRVDADDVAVVVLNRTLRDQCRETQDSDAQGRAYANASDVVQGAALRRLGIPVDGTGPLDAPLLDDDFVNWSRVAAFRSAWDDASDQVRSDWLRQHRDRVLSCALRDEDLTL